MDNKKLSIPYRHGTLTELNPALKSLAEAARNASQNAHAPYSEFKVGAAVSLTKNGMITGNNQENASYPTGLCAERVAIFYAHAQYPDDPIQSIAVYAPVSDSRIIPSPCGSCRQVISEFRNLQDSSIEVLLLNDRDEVWVFEDVLDLLPFDFNAMHLL